MTTPFTEEVKKAIKSLKNDKSPGVDEIVVEQLVAKEINRDIVDLMNERKQAM